ncbi:MAG: RagB/SusD family nutrient uptake outer membrane protein [Pedobacter sp.]|jgi:hypothetical protein
MKKIRAIIIGSQVFMFLLLYTSCTKQDLNQVPISSISTTSFWKTQADANGGLYGMYSLFRTQAAHNHYIFGELRSEIFGPSPFGTAGYEQYFNNTMNSSNVSPSYPANITTWQNLYTVINHANLLLKYVPNISYTSETTKKSTLAQAYAMRAFVYYMMVRTWGDLVIRTEPIEKVDISLQKERSPKAEVFKLIKADIEAAITNFPDNTMPSGRNTWSLAGVNALKADVYLWTGKLLGGGAADFNVALSACDAVATADVALLPDFVSIFNYGNKGNKEIIMASYLHHLESVTNIYQYMTLAANTTFATLDEESKKALAGLGGLTYLAPTALVTNQFSSDDQRTTASFVNVYTISSTGVRNFHVTTPVKFRGAPGFGAYDDIVLYRYADVLLMRAEAKNALGQDPSSDINMVRQRAYKTNYSSHVFVNGTQAQNDVAILQERLFELIFEGKRWWDLVRFNQAFNIVPSLKTQPTATHLLLWPISLSTLSIEPKVKQNPGY